MSDRMERETMQKFFQYIKGYNYVPSRNYVPPSHYDLQPYSNNYALAQPNHLPKQPSLPEQAARSANPNINEYFRNNQSFDYTGFKQGMMPTMSPIAAKIKKSNQSQAGTRGMQSNIALSNSNMQNPAQLLPGQINPYQIPGPNHLAGYGYPYMNYSGMNPYNPYCMYPPYYYNRPQMYANSGYPFQRTPETQNAIKQEIVISSDSQENAVNSEHGFKKKNRMGYTVYENIPPAPQQQVNQLQSKKKSKQSKNQKLNEHSEKVIERVPKYINHQLLQQEHIALGQRMKLFNQNKSYIIPKLEKQAQRQSKFKEVKEAKEVKEIKEVKKIKEVKEIKDGKDGKQVNVIDCIKDVKQSSRQKKQKDYRYELEGKDQDEDNGQSKGKSNVREYQPFYIKKKRIYKQFKPKRQDSKLQKNKKIRQKGYSQVVDTMKRNKDGEDNQNNEPKIESLYQYCQKLSAKGSQNSKSELKKQKSMGPEKEEKQNLKKQKVKDDHPLRELRYSQSHGRIRLGPYYQSSIPTLLNGEHMVSMRRQLQSKLRERQISAITF